MKKAVCKTQWNVFFFLNFRIFERTVLFDVRFSTFGKTPNLKLQNSSFDRTVRMSWWTREFSAWNLVKCKGKLSKYSLELYHPIHSGVNSNSYRMCGKWKLLKPFLLLVLVEILFSFLIDLFSDVETFSRECFTGVSTFYEMKEIRAH